MVRALSPLIAPESTPEPGALEISKGSPVRKDSSMRPRPSATPPSTGQISDGPRSGSDGPRHRGQRRRGAWRFARARSRRRASGPRSRQPGTGRAGPRRRSRRLPAGLNQTLVRGRGGRSDVRRKPKHQVQADSRQREQGDAGIGHSGYFTDFAAEPTARDACAAAVRNVCGSPRGPRRGIHARTRRRRPRPSAAAGVRRC